MKRLIILLSLAVLVAGFFGIGYVGIQGPVFAQDSPVATPTPVMVPPEPPPVPPTPIPPTPIPPTLLELILELIQELAGWLTGLILGVIGMAQKETVSRVRRWFPNSDKTASKINGGLAKVFAGLTAIVLALIAWGVTFLSGYAGGLDLGSILVLASAIFGAGEGMHKVNKLSSIAKALKASS